MCAILAGLLWMTCGASQDAYVQDDETIRVTFRLTDGVRIDGELRTWDDSGFDGSFGKRAWQELMPRDAWRILRRLSNDERIEDWARLGSIMLRFEHTDATRYADHAFAQAQRLDSEHAPALIEQARKDAKDYLSNAEAAAAQRRDLTLSVHSPEAKQWSHARWPVPDRQQQNAARLALFADAEEALRQAGLVIEPIEADHIILYTQFPREEAARLAVYLDQQVQWLNKLFDLDEDAEVFWGKLVVMVLSDEDAFRLIEIGAFKQLLPEHATAIAHFTGPKAFINATAKREGWPLRAKLNAQLAFAYLHRSEAPKRLPAWANEGLAGLMYQRAVDEAKLLAGLREDALREVRSGRSLAWVFERTYTDDEPIASETSLLRALGSLLVDDLIKRDRKGFIAWVRSVKSLDPARTVQDPPDTWATRFRLHFNILPGQYLQMFQQFYRVND
ncbi:MAG: hypothetical protein ACR2GY_11885 [Phycisphaerales bacterium]